MISCLSINEITVSVPKGPRDTDKLDVTGKLSSVFLLPQYLHKAIFAGANAFVTDEEIRILSLIMFFTNCCLFNDYPF